MKLTNSFTVPVSVDEAWKVLLDAERVAPCMPGATLDEVSGDEVKGRVKVKVGPITVTYSGVVVFQEKDESTHRAVLEASGREMRGSGTASASITTVMHEVDGSTIVDVVTDLNVTGKPAQFGRGVMAEVSRKLIQQFADGLAVEIQRNGSGPVAAGRTGATAASAAGGGATGPSLLDGESSAVVRPSADAIDLLDAAGASVMKRVAPVGLVLLVVLIAGWLARKRMR
jgi:carbon monoxide dehydrogenase subunit G